VEHIINQRVIQNIQIHNFFQARSTAATADVAYPAAPSESIVSSGSSEIRYSIGAFTL